MGIHSRSARSRDCSPLDGVEHHIHPAYLVHLAVSNFCPVYPGLWQLFVWTSSIPALADPLPRPAGVLAGVEFPRRTCIVTPALRSSSLTFIPTSQSSIGDAEMAVKVRVRVMCTTDRQTARRSTSQEQIGPDQVETEQDKMTRWTGLGERRTEYEYTGMQFPLSSCYYIHTPKHRSRSARNPPTGGEATQARKPSLCPLSNDLFRSIFGPQPPHDPSIQPAGPLPPTPDRAVGRELCRCWLSIPTATLPYIHHPPPTPLPQPQ